jgi:hypothetical protein
MKYTFLFSLTLLAASFGALQAAAVVAVPHSTVQRTFIDTHLNVTLPYSRILLGPDSRGKIVYKTSEETPSTKAWQEITPNRRIFGVAHGVTRPLSADTMGRQSYSERIDFTECLEEKLADGTTIYECTGSTLPGVVNDAALFHTIENQVKTVFEMPAR